MTIAVDWEVENQTKPPAKCRAFYVVLEKRHGAWKKGTLLEKKGMAWRHA